MSQHAKVYRGVLRELSKATIAPRKVNNTVTTKFRTIIQQSRDSGNAHALHNVESALIFLRSQREHKALLERYNPLFDLTAEERIHATARRVGLDMPITHKPESVQ